MDKKVWAVEKDDNIQCQLLTSEYLEDAIDLMENAFLLHENVCVAIDVPKYPKAIAELKELTRATAKDGVTVIAVDKKLNKVVGAAFNKLQVKNSSNEETSFFEKFANSCKERRAQAVLRFMLETDALCNLFEHCQVDCVLEIMFLGTLPEYRGKGIAQRLCEISLEIGKTLLDGVNIKQSVDGRKLNLEPVPKVASAIFTSFVTQRIGRKLGFEIAVTKSFDQFEYDGRLFSSVIGPETPYLTLEYKRL